MDVVRFACCLRVVAFALLILPFSSFAEGQRYTLNTHGGYYTSISDACLAAPVPDPSGLPSAWSNVSFTGNYNNTGVITCELSFDFTNPNGTGGTSKTFGYATVRLLSACVAGTTKTTSVPVGRDNSGVYQDFGTYYAYNQCFAGCDASYVGGDGSNEAYTKPEDTDTLVYENLVYELTGSSCSTSSSEPVFTPPAPPAPDPEELEEPDPVDPENPGGGETGGGGDSGGGGDTGGGGDSGGGGDTGGGGDSGGGDTGGGGGNCTGDGSCNDVGDGDGDGDSEDNGDVRGLACDQSFTCTGDVIQCGVLKLQREQVCAWKLGDNELGAIEHIQSGEDYQLKEETLEVSGLFTEALNKGRWLPQSCPAPESISIMGKVYEISYEPLCRFALALGPVLVAMASLFFAVYVGRGLKGN